MSKNKTTDTIQTILDLRNKYRTMITETTEHTEKLIIKSKIVVLGELLDELGYDDDDNTALDILLEEGSRS